MPSKQPDEQSNKQSFNTESIKKTLRETLITHKVDLATASEIIEDYERNLTRQWQADGVEMRRFNEIFEKKEKAASGSGGSRTVS